MQRLDLWGMQHQMTIGISAATVNQLYRCAPLHRIPPAPCPYLTPWRCALFSCRRPCLPALPAAPSKALPATPSKAPPALPTCLSACVHRMTRVLAQRAKATCWQSLARRSGRPAVQSRRPAAPVGHGKRSCRSRRFHSSSSRKTQRYLGRRCFVMCLAPTHCCHPHPVAGSGHLGRPSV